MNSSNATTSTPTVMILSTCKHIEVEHSIMKIGGRLLQSVCQSRWRTLLCSELMEQKRRGYTFTCRDYLLMWPGKQEVRCDRLEQCLLPFLQIACCTEISSVMHISKGLIGWSCIATHFQLCTQTIFAVPKAVLSKASDSYMIKGSVLKKKKWWGRTQMTQEEASYTANAMLVLYWSSMRNVPHTKVWTWLNC